MKRYTEQERPLPPVAPAACYDCGFPYENPAWIEAIVDADTWEIINPSYYKGGGLLCIQCMAKRCVDAGLEYTPIVIRGGIFQSENITMQSGDPLTWADIHEGLLNTVLAPLRWLREQLARLVERVWVR